LQPGDFEISKIEWELFEVVKCSQPLSENKDSSTKFKVIEASGECEAKVYIEG
jgi:hypothetical protein